MTINPSSAEINDLVDLQELDEDTLLDCIRNRFHRNIIYTYIGDVLIAVNPFKQLPIYGDKHHLKYKEVTGRNQNTPHVYWIAGNALRNLRKCGRRYCIIVGGISGAGKTESTKHILEHILFQGERHHSNLVDRLKEINPLLELFGNAVTRLNDNSSRFGKLIALKYDNLGNLNEANISCYMLERSRVTRQHDRERNFHIFYAFTDDIPEHFLRTFRLSRHDLQDSRIINGHKTIDRDKAALEFAHRVMRTIGFTDEQIEDMYRILAAVLVVATVEFQDDVPPILKPNAHKRTVPIVCSLLGIQEDMFKMALVSSSSYTRNGELIRSNKNIQKARDGRDAFAKYLYSCLFDGLVEQINTFLGYTCMSEPYRNNRESKTTNELCILDIAGFENLTSFETYNSYEQLLINITNEHMHQYFLKKIVKAELETYQREGIRLENLPDMNEIDNERTMELLTKPKIGVLGILESATLAPGQDDADFVRLLADKYETSDCFKLNPRNSCSFRIKHYAGEVEYDARGFLEKNRDTMTEDLKACLENSTNFFLQSFRGYSSEGQGKLQGFQSREYRGSLKSLVGKLEETEPLFVRCIKPNERQIPDNFDETFVKDQLLRSGILEIAKVRKQGFSVRVSFEEFIRRFGTICENVQHNLSPKTQVTRVLREANIHQYSTGDRLVFLKFDGLDTLQSMVAEKERKKIEAEEKRKRQKEADQGDLEDKIPMWIYPTDLLSGQKDLSKASSPTAPSVIDVDSGISTTASPASTATKSLTKEAAQKIKEESENNLETLAFDAFRQVEMTDEDNRIIERYVLPVVRLFMFACLFAIILTSGTVMKLLFRNLIDNYSKEPENSKNMVNLLLCLGIPPTLTLLTSLVKVLFGSVKSLKKRYLIMVVMIEFLHTLGVGVLIFNILPHFDAFRGNIVLLNVAIMPSLLKLVMKSKCSNCVPGRKLMYPIIAVVAYTSQMGGAVATYIYTITKDVIHTNDTGIFKLRLMYPAVIFLISLEWWENFISGRLKLFKTVDFDSLRRHLEKTRMKTTTILMVVKLVTIVCYALFIAKLDILEIKKLNTYKSVIEKTTGELLQMNTTITPKTMFVYNLENVPTQLIRNTSTNETEEIRTFVHQSNNYTCATENQNGTSLILSCSVNETVIKFVCDNNTMICLQESMVSGPTTPTDSDIFNAHYIVLEDTADSVTFTNHTNNVTCSKQNEPNNMVRLFCKNRGTDLQLLCESGYKECARIYAEKDTSLVTRIVSLWEDNYVVMCTLLLSSIFTYCCVLACKLHMQQFSFSLSIVLISPLTSGMIYINCSGILHFRGIIPDVMSCAPMDFESIKISVILAGALWIGLLLLTSYIWIPRYERMAKVERLFVEPLRECFFIDINMLLRRKNDRTHRQQKDPEMSRNELDRGGRRDVPQIKVCATMWHETVTEMSQLLKSLFRLDYASGRYRSKIRLHVLYSLGPYSPAILQNSLSLILQGFQNLLDIHHAASLQAEKSKNVRDPDSFTPEIHIIFDDAFDTVTIKDKKIRQPNSYVLQFLECNDKAAREIAQCSANEWDSVPSKKVTPFGAQLTFKLPGGTMMFVHMKDKMKVRHRKRWSQILYLYYLLGFKTFGMKTINEVLKRPANAGASLFSFLKKEYQEQMRNTFLLTLDGDVDFNPDAVILLLDRMKKNPKTGAVCGRIHPIGSGPMVWYQQFEYAIGHWLQKAAEHVLGCVLCCPGCFSLFRASALMDDNVMNTYTTKPTEARHYIQFEQGEDRWLCTLLLQRGHKIDYEAGADALTYAPETFKEFFVQRRRWAPSTMANIMDLLSSWRSTVKRNDNISTLYMIYQFVMLLSSLLAPATVTLVIAGSYSSVLNLDATYSFYLSLAPIVLFMIVCLKCKNDTQLNVAALLCSIYTLVMIIVTVGTILNIANDDFLSPNVIFLAGLCVIFTFAGLWHPKEIGCLVHGLLYYFTVPSTFIFLTVYFFCNLNNVSWGTREGPKSVETSQGSSTVTQPERKKTFLSKLLDLIKGSCCEDLIQSISIEIQDRFNKGNAQTKGNTAPDASQIHTKTKNTEEVIDREAWMYMGEFKTGEVLPCDEDETKFWNEILRKYLYPLDNDQKHQAQMKSDLATLRNNIVFAFFMTNLMFAVALLQLQLNKEKILSYYIAGKYEPVSIIFLGIFATLLVTQFIAMLLHRWGTFLHLISNCKVNILFSSAMTDEEQFRFYQKEAVSLMNGKNPNLNDNVSDSASTGEKESLHADEHRNDDIERDYPTEESDDGDLKDEPQNNVYDERFRKNYPRAKKTVRYRQRRELHQRPTDRRPDRPRDRFYDRNHPLYTEYSRQNGRPLRGRRSSSRRKRR